MRDLSFIHNADASYIDALYQSYQRDPASVDEAWHSFFKGFDFAGGKQADGSTHEILSTIPVQKELAVLGLIQAYRQRAHLLSDTNPIRKRRDRDPRLDLSDFGLTEADLPTRFQASSALGMSGASLEETLRKLRSVYCSTIGFEYQHLDAIEKRNWLQQRIENRSLEEDQGLELEEKKRILEKLNGAVIFEKFLHTKYVGQKRFSLEGGETTIAALDAIIEYGSENGIEELILGMAHRGRLNVLANIMGKTYEQIFNEFEGNALPDLSFGSGDVKYHLGFSSQIKTQKGKLVQLKLAPNPSHLEAVNPVVTGMARAKADLLYQSEYNRILPVLIHGDSAIAGQGVVYETAQMSQLEGYYAGGTIHLVINNQIGFTTDFDDARSSTYCTAVAQVIQAPVFHVNGDDPEAVVFVSRLAASYRKAFHSDVFIDIVCYRRHGHNEGDDPKFTQPEMYEIISNHPNVREIYSKVLEQRGDLQARLAQSMEKEFWDHLQERLNLVKEKPLPYQYQEPELAWRNLRKVQQASDFDSSPVTGIAPEMVKDLLSKLLTTPDGFKVLPKIKRLFKSWEDLIQSNQADWSLAELLAYASLLIEGKNVRMSGQDVKRGTFSHRHAVLIDEKNNTAYNRLSAIHKNQGRFFIYNSLLSEFGVLGFEYGYSLVSPDQLVLWEAQFGDFANGAQVAIDQFIATAQSKWNRMSGLVLLLPHGYDGQGPEHSSARLERFLQACAENNMIVANVSTPANFFHLLRRQLHWEFRKPLIVMSPKSLLRHPRCISKLDAFAAESRFQEVLEDPVQEIKKIKKLVFCSGQLYYDLLMKKENLGATDHHLVRLEQLYPLPEKQIQEILRKFPKATPVWVQEEPRNKGAAGYIRQQEVTAGFQIHSRPASASPAVGYKKIHDLQLAELLDSVFK